MSLSSCARLLKTAKSRNLDVLHPVFRRRLNSQSKKAQARQRRDGLAALDRAGQGQSYLQELLVATPDAAHGNQGIASAKKHRCKTLNGSAFVIFLKTP
jgi:hypothetical protein